MPQLPGNQPALVRTEHVKVGAWTTLTLWSGRRIGRGFRILSHHPIVVGTLAAIVLLVLLSPLLVGVAGVVSAGALGAWRLRRPASYHEHVAHRVRGLIRGLFIYRRKWRRAMIDCGIIAERDVAPVLLGVTSSAKAGVDTLTVRMPDGHKIEHYKDHTDQLAPTFGGFLCTARPVPNVQGSIQKRLPTTTHESLAYRPHEVQLKISTRDVLVDPIAPAELDFDDPFPARGWRLGLRGDSPTWEPAPFLFRLTQPTIIGGATQSGKTSLVRTMARAMVPGIQQGLIRAGAINPKGDATLGAASHLFDRYTAGASGADVTLFEEPIAWELENYVKFLRFRAEDLGEGGEEFTPSREYPLLPLFIDEGALLVFYATNPRMRRRMRSAVSILASQGAGLGVIPIFLLQDPRVQIMEMRELFTRRMVLRTSKPEQMGYLLEGGDQLAPIPDDERHQGYAYAEEQGRSMITRWRAAHTTVRDIRMCPPHPVLPPLVDEMRMSPVAMA